MAQNNIKCYGYDVEDAASDYQYIAIVWESSGVLGECFASNNFRDIKSYVYNQVKQLYSDARGHIYCSSDTYLDYPLYMCWNEGCKTYKKKLIK